jgi:hypothetical protein
MTMRQLTCMALVLLLWSSATLALAQDGRCFRPLTDFSDRAPADFSDMATSPSTTPAKGVIRFEPVTSGKGDVNIDFLYVSFSPPNGMTLATFFKIIRLRFPLFAAGKTHRFGFGPYDESGALNDSVGQANLRKWESDNPLGALMSFNLDTLWPSSVIPGAGAPGNGRWITEKAGDVQVTCASTTDFIFSTVESDYGGMHPVAGNRGFGLMSSADGQTWTFYSKAVDRDSGSKMNLPLLLPGQDSVFCKGQSFWIDFFSEIRNYLKGRGLKVKTWSLANHGPVAYPFPSGQQPAAKCDGDLANLPNDTMLSQ